MLSLKEILKMKHVLNTQYTHISTEKDRKKG